MADVLDSISLPEAKLALNIASSDTSNDTELAQVITAASRWLDSIVGAVVSRTYTNQDLDVPPGADKVVLPWVPEISHYTSTVTVSAVSEYQSGTATVLTAESLTTAGTYRVRYGRLERRSSWQPYTFSADGIRVSYSTGRFATTAAVDPQFKQACVLILHHLWQQRGASPGVFTDDGQAFGAVPLAQTLAKQVRNMLPGEWLPGIA